MKIALDEMFYVTQDVVTALQDWLKTTAQDGLTKIPGENVAVLTAQIDAVCERLAENKKLTGKTPVLVLTAFTKCSVKQFTGPFELILNSERVKNMGTPASLDDDNKKTLTQVRDILLMANNEFHSLNTAKKWNVPEGRISACYNCDGDHLLPDCKEPRDEAKIVRNRKAAWEHRKKDGKVRPDGRKQWEKKKFHSGGCGKGGGAGTTNTGNGVKYMNGKWMCKCNKASCGWNETHTTKFHGAWLKNPQSFKLPPTHLFMIKAGKSDGTNYVGAGSGGTTPGNKGASSGGGGGTTGLSATAKSQLKTLVNKHKTETEDSSLSQFFSDFGSWVESLN